MENIRVLVVEDKLMIAEHIASMLKKNSMDVIGVCVSGEEAIETSRTKNPDLILMDIELSGAIDGISAAQIIHQDQEVPIIYLSDYTDNKTIDRAKKTIPANFLAKPFHGPDLIRAIEIAFSNSKQSGEGKVRPKEHVFLRTTSQVFVKVALRDILYLEANRAYCKLVTVDKVYDFSSSMNHVNEQLNYQELVKVHRSYIVNVSRITSLDGNIIKMGSREVQMSKEYRDNLMSILKIIK